MVLTKTLKHGLEVDSAKCFYCLRFYLINNTKLFSEGDATYRYSCVVAYGIYRNCLPQGDLLHELVLEGEPDETRNIVNIEFFHHVTSVRVHSSVAYE